MKQGIGPCPLPARSCERWWLDFVTFTTQKKKSRLSLKRRNAFRTGAKIYFSKKIFWGYGHFNLSNNPLLNLIRWNWHDEWFDSEAMFLIIPWSVQTLVKILTQMIQSASLNCDQDVHFSPVRRIFSVWLMGLSANKLFWTWMHQCSVK